MPIAGLKTLKMQGTMDFYFSVSDEWYAATARHVLFPEDEGNDDNLEIKCPSCEEEFDNNYNFLQHFEEVHVLKL